MNLEGKKDFESLSAGELIDYIISRHHAFTRESLKEVCRILNELAKNENSKEVNDLLYSLARFKDDIEQHMRKEEFILFPLFKKLTSIEHRGIEDETLPCGMINNPIKIIRKEHEHMSHLMSDLHIMTRNFTPLEETTDGIKLCLASLLALEKDYYQHIYLENDILFPKVLQFEKSISKALS